MPPPTPPPGLQECLLRDYDLIRMPHVGEIMDSITNQTAWMFLPVPPYRAWRTWFRDDARLAYVIWYEPLGTGRWAAAAERGAS